MLDGYGVTNTEGEMSGTIFSNTSAAKQSTSIIVCDTAEMSSYVTLLQRIGATDHQTNWRCIAWVDKLQAALLQPLPTHIIHDKQQ